MRPQPHNPIFYFFLCYNEADGLCTNINIITANEDLLDPCLARFRITLVYTPLEAATPTISHAAVAHRPHYHLVMGVRKSNLMLNMTLNT